MALTFHSHLQASTQVLWLVHLACLLSNLACVVGMIQHSWSKSKNQSQQDIFIGKGRQGYTYSDRNKCSYMKKKRCWQKKTHNLAAFGFSFAIHLHIISGIALSFMDFILTVTQSWCKAKLWWTMITFLFCFSKLWIFFPLFCEYWPHFLFMFLSDSANRNLQVKINYRYT